MTVTEDEATKKWCPEAREGAIGESHLPKRRADGYRCIGSECMAWRWSPTLQGKGYCGYSGQPVA